ncbi:hypothetical protein GCM10023088_52010 [Actinomadura verrucosospora]|uniref:hypothetical protein n=1 Tax=Actinomadura verrucosospora TaxID=46165 RepID=UPI0031E5BF73
MANSDGSAPFRFNVTKTYPARGPLQQYRVDTTTAFTCCRCGQVKKSKLITTTGGTWDRLLCNGCYGRLLSIWEIKSGSLDDTERYDELHRLLTSLVAEAEIAQAASLIRARDQRAEQLSREAMVVLSTAEAVASSLVAAATELDWSAAIIGLCKAVEIEALRLLVVPLKASVTQLDLRSDLSHRDMQRVARFCTGRGTPPELGTLAHFLTAASDPRRGLASSTLLASFRLLVRSWPASDWLFAPDGFPGSVTGLTRTFRNPAAHTELLDQTAYQECSTLVQGEDGILWKLLVATTG